MQDPWPDRCRTQRSNTLGMLPGRSSMPRIAAALLPLCLAMSGCRSLNYPEVPAATPAHDPTTEGHVAPNTEPGAWVPLSRAGRNALKMRDYDAAEQNYVAALAETTMLPEYDTRVRTALGNVVRIAATYQAQRRWNDSDRLVDLIIENAEAGRGADFSVASPVFIGQGNYRTSHDRSEDAIVVYEATRLLWNADAPQHEAARVQTGQLIAMAYLDAGMPEEAITRMQGLVEDVSRIFGPASAATASAYFKLASAYEQDNDFSRAEEAYQRSLEIRESIDPDGLELANLRNQVASFYADHDRNEQAAELAGLAVATLEAHDVQGANLAAVLDTLASAQTQLGRSDEAEANFKRALAARDQTDPEIRPQLDRVLENYALLLRSLDRDEEARTIEAEISSDNDR
ncbi:MAG: tetratricopeptide repeat protein [Deltaproteobacteria bacterium]|nr:tetratricopeptide repeat protein [Deltaproteobacteria bacterium]